MKNLKKTLLILLSAASIALSGCGNAASGPAAGTAATEAASEESTEKESIAASGTAGEESAETAGTASASTNEMPPAVAPDASVSYLGPAGTYTEEAAQYYFSDGIFQPKETVDDAIADVLNNEADYAVIPQENTLGGAVTNYVDALIAEEVEHDERLELELRVHHGDVALVRLENEVVRIDSARAVAVAEQEGAYARVEVVALAVDYDFLAALLKELGDAVGDGGLAVGACHGDNGAVDLEHFAAFSVCEVPQDNAREVARVAPE